MKTKTKRPRIAKPVIQVKPTEPAKSIIPDKPKDVIELVSIPVSRDALSSCEGCFFNVDEKCTDTESRDCAGIIFVKE